MFTNERLFTIQAFTITRVHCTWIWENKILGHFEKNCQGVVVEEGGIFLIFRGWWWKVMGGRGREEFFFSNLTLFLGLIFNLKICTSNFQSFKVASKSFLFKNFKTGLTFWLMWFFNFRNLVRSCKHIGGTPCKNIIWKLSSHIDLSI